MFFSQAKYNPVGLSPRYIPLHSDSAELFQAFGEQAEALKELEAKINALQNSLSAKDVELAKVGTFSCLQLLVLREKGT